MARVKISSRKLISSLALAISAAATKEGAGVVVVVVVVCVVFVVVAVVVVVVVCVVVVVVVVVVIVFVVVVVVVVGQEADWQSSNSREFPEHCWELSISSSLQERPLTLDPWPHEAVHPDQCPHASHSAAMAHVNLLDFYRFLWCQ